jgi:hypothetical protein
LIPIFIEQIADLRPAAVAAMTGFMPTGVQHHHVAREPRLERGSSSRCRRIYDDGPCRGSARDVGQRLGKDCAFSAVLTESSASAMANGKGVCGGFC